ncbi:MAG: FeoA family protein [Candidatus Gastranaerophilales bacterium]|nr:FeoA family protein [Candidatus Gastranaerophilales bacterium]
MVKLSEVKVGQKAEIFKFIDSSNIKLFSSRFGIEEGQLITCIAKPGPVVISKNQQEIAIGRDLSRQIYVKVI